MRSKDAGQWARGAVKIALRDGSDRSYRRAKKAIAAIPPSKKDLRAQLNRGLANAALKDPSTGVMDQLNNILLETTPRIIRQEQMGWGQEADAEIIIPPKPDSSKPYIIYYARYDTAHYGVPDSELFTPANRYNQTLDVRDSSQPLGTRTMRTELPLTQSGVVDLVAFRGGTPLSDRQRIAGSVQEALASK